VSERLGRRGAAQRAIEQKQRQWRASVCNAAMVDRSGCFARIEDNLFQQRLSPEFLKGFRSGSGNELAAKIRSLNSSAALVVNVFQSLLESERAAHTINEIFGLPYQDDDAFCFAAEAQFYTGAGGKPANLDLLINTGDRTLAIESKFIEPYRGLSYKNSDDKREFRDAYFSQRRQPIWSNLSYCLEEARRIDFARRHGRPRYTRFDAPQLLKHLLALESNNPARGTPHRRACYYLVNLWYWSDSAEAKDYCAEARMFFEAIRPDLITDRRELRLLTYQEIFSRVETAIARSATERQYLEYLRSRYF
jgi:hypothetical protein